MTIEEYPMKQIAKYAYRACGEYLQSKKHRREFESWYLKTYGMKYEWKKVKRPQAVEALNG